MDYRSSAIPSMFRMSQIEDITQYFSGNSFEIPNDGLWLYDQPLENIVQTDNPESICPAIISENFNGKDAQSEQNSLYTNKQYIEPISIFNYHENTFDFKPNNIGCDDKINYSTSTSNISNKSQTLDENINLFDEIFDNTYEALYLPQLLYAHTSEENLNKANDKSKPHYEKINEIEVDFNDNSHSRNVTASEITESSLIESIEESMNKYRLSSFQKMINQNNLEEESIEYPPFFTKVLLPQYVHENYEANFWCELKGNPHPQIIWTAGGIITQSNTNILSDDINIVNNEKIKPSIKRKSLDEALLSKNRYRLNYRYPKSELKIFNTIKNDANIYTCEAVNKLGNALTSTTLNIWPVNQIPDNVEESEKIRDEYDSKMSSSDNQVLKNKKRLRRRTKITNIIQEILADQTLEEDIENIDLGSKGDDISEYGHIKEIKIDFDTISKEDFSGMGDISRDNIDYSNVANKEVDLDSNKILKGKRKRLHRSTPFNSSISQSSSSSDEYLTEDIPYGSSFTNNDLEISTLLDISKNTDLTSFSEDIQDNVVRKILENAAKKFRDNKNLEPDQLEIQRVDGIERNGKPPEFVITMEATKAYEHETIIIKLKVIGDPIPNIQWYKGPDMIDETHKISESTLTKVLNDKVIYKKDAISHVSFLYNYPDIVLIIKNMSKMDEDLYTCVAINDFGKACTSSTITVLDEKEITNVKKMGLQSGDSVISSGEPDDTFNISKEYEHLAIDQDDQGDMRRTSFYETKYIESSVRSEKVMKEVPFSNGSPKIIAPLKDARINIESNKIRGQDIVIHLETIIDGLPVPKVNWYKDGKNIKNIETTKRYEEQTSNIYKIIDKSPDNKYILEINLSKIFDSGGDINQLNGIYTCVASNLNGEASTSSKIVITIDMENVEKLHPGLQISIERDQHPGVSYLETDEPDLSGISQNFITIKEEKLYKSTTSGESKKEAEPSFIKPLKSQLMEIKIDKAGNKKYPLDIVLECQVEGQPRPDIKWYFTKVDHKGHESEIEKNRPTVHLEYQDNIIDSSSQTTITTKTTETTKETTRTQILSEEEPGGDVRFHKYYSPKDGKIILYITLVSESNEGVYTCEATNDHGKASTFANIMFKDLTQPGRGDTLDTYKVTEKSERIEISKSSTSLKDIYIEEGADLEINIDITDKSYKPIICLHESNIISTSIDQHIIFKQHENGLGNVLKINDVKKEDGGEYIFKNEKMEIKLNLIIIAKNTYDLKSEKVFHRIKIKPDKNEITEETFEYPHLKEEDIQETEVEEGSQLELTVTLSREVKNLSWKKDGRSLYPDKRIYILDQGKVQKLLINNVIPDDEGIYICEFEGKHIKTRVIVIPKDYSQSSLDTREVRQSYERDVYKVHEKPKIPAHIIKSMDKDNIIVTESGDDIEIVIEIPDSIKPPVILLKDNTPVSKEDRRISTTIENNKIIFKIDQIKSSDEGLYVFDTGEKQNVIHIIVKESKEKQPKIFREHEITTSETFTETETTTYRYDADQISMDKDEMEIPIRLFTKTQHAEVPENNNLDIIIKTSHEIPNIFWEKDNIIVDESEKVEKIKSGMDHHLIIKEVTKSDHGVYMGSYEDKKIIIKVTIKEPKDVIVDESQKNADEVRVTSLIMKRPSQTPILMETEAYPGKKIKLETHIVDQPDKRKVDEIVEESFEEIRKYDSDVKRVDEKEQKPAREIKKPHVKEIPTENIKEIQEIEVDQGATLEITVTLSREIKDVKWKKDETEILEDDRVKFVQQGVVYKLVVSKVDHEDKGIYSLEFEGKKVKTRVIINEIPVEKLEEVNIVEIEEGSRLDLAVTLPRKVDTVTWKKDETEILKDDRISFQPEGVVQKLVISKVVPEDKGVYALEFEGEQVKTEVVVKEIPTEKIEEIQVIEVDQGATLEITVTLSREIKDVKWKKDETEILEDDRVKFVQQGVVYKLVVSKVDHKDKGIYSLEFEGKKVKTRVIINALPVQSVKMETVEVEEGSTLELTISLSEVIKDVTWLKDDNKIYPGDRIKYEQQGEVCKLSISDAIIRDEGIYSMCFDDQKIDTKVIVIPTIKPKIEMKVIEVDEGQRLNLSVTLPKKVEKVTWKKDDLKILENDHVYSTQHDLTHQLVISKVKGEDAGIYSLEFDDNKILTNVLVKRMPIEDIQTIEVDEGSTLEISITLPNKPDQFEWKKDDTYLVEDDRIQFPHDDFTYKLVISNVKPEDKGIYNLQYDDSDVRTKVVIKGLPTKHEVKIIEKFDDQTQKLSETPEDAYFVEKLKDVTLIINQPLLLQVKLSKPVNDTEIIWVKDDTILSEKTIDLSRIILEKSPIDNLTYTLNIKKTKLEDGGVYKCIYKKMETSANVEIKDLPITEDAYFVEKLKDVTLIVDQPLLLRVKLSKPVNDNEIIWVKDDQILFEKTIDTSRIIMEKSPSDNLTYTLNIKKTKLEDGGIYKCIYKMKETSANVEIKDLPIKHEIEIITKGDDQTQKLSETLEDAYFVEKLKDVTLIVDQPLLLQVKLSKPVNDNEIIWVKDDQILSEKTIDISRIIMEKNLSDNLTYTLNIKKTKLEDEGFYKCIYRKKETSANVEIKEIDFMKGLCDQEVNEGSSVIMTVTFNGPPFEEEIIWKKNSIIINEFEKQNMKLEKEGLQYTLIIKSIKKDQEGNYSCHYKNKETRGHISVMAVPSPPQKLSIQYKDVNIIFKWEKPLNDGGSPIISYAIEIREKAKENWIHIMTVKWDIFSIMLTDLSIQKTYRIRVKATNIVGNSLPAELEDDLMIPASIKADVPSPPLDLKASNLREKIGISLEWDKPETDGGSQILGYILEIRKASSQKWIHITDINDLTCLKDHMAYLVDKNIEVNEEYYLRVFAFNQIGTSQPAVTTTPIKISRILTVPSPPKGPVIIREIPEGSRNFEIGWNPPDSDGGSPIRNYILQISSNNGLTWEPLVKVSGDTLMAIIKNLKPNQDYIIRIQAQNDIGLSEPLQSSSFLSRGEILEPKLTSQTSANASEIHEYFYSFDLYSEDIPQIKP